MTDRTELRRLLAAATPGPWALYDGWLHEGRAHVARIGNAAGNGIGAPATDMAGEISDFELIAAAVNNLEPLLDQLDAAGSALNDAVLYEHDCRDALARQTPHYLAARARIEAVRELHRETTVKVLAPACADEECDHEDDCPLVDYAVCTECYGIGDEAHPYAYEEGGVERVAWPCPTIAALGGEQS